MKKGWCEINIELLRQADWNYKTDDPALMNKLVANIKRNGQIENIIVRELDGAYEVINGNHRLKAMRQLNLTKVMAFNVGVLSLLDAQRIAIETNETKFHADDEKLSKIIASLAEGISQEDFLSTMPFTAAQLDEFAHMAKFTWEQFEKNPELEKGIKHDDRPLRLLVAASDLDRWMKLKDDTKEDDRVLFSKLLDSYHAK